ncbi:hypothetical protein ACHWQZ_G009569, partial [Mnemiopsis leidyi]
MKSVLEVLVVICSLLPWGSPAVSLGSVNCWAGGTGSYNPAYSLGHQQFTDYLSCQTWCGDDPSCTAVVVANSICVKVSTENIASLPGAQTALKDCWTQTVIKAKTTHIGDDQRAKATCGDGYTAVDCFSDYPMSSALDGVVISAQSCVVTMSASSNQHVDVTATCRLDKKCLSTESSTPTKYKYLKHNDWVTGTKKLTCPSGYDLLSCYITSAWSQQESYGKFSNGAKTTTSTCTFTSNIRFSLSAVCQVSP